MLQNLFGNIALDATIKSLKNVISKITFSQTGGLRTEPTGGTITTINTVGHIGGGSLNTVGSVNDSKTTLGDTTKNSTVQQMSAISFYGTVGRNFDRTNSFGEW